MVRGAGNACIQREGIGAVVGRVVEAFLHKEGIVLGQDVFARVVLRRVEDTEAAAKHRLGRELVGDADARLNSVVLELTSERELLPRPASCTRNVVMSKFDSLLFAST